MSSEEHPQFPPDPTIGEARDDEVIAEAPLRVPRVERPAGASGWSTGSEREEQHLPAAEAEVVSESPFSEQSRRAIRAIEEGLSEDSCTQIDGYGPSRFSAQVNGQNMMMEGIAFSSPEEYLRWIRSLVDGSDSVVSWGKIDADRMGVLELNDGSRLAIFLPPIARPHPTFSLRKHTAAKWQPTQLIEMGTLDERMLKFLQACVAAHVNILFVGAMGAGKAQPLDANVLTPSGWKRMGEIEVGSEVIGSDGRAHNVTGVFPQGEKEIYRVSFSDGTATECCADHLWQVNTASRKHRGGVPLVRPLKELIGDLKDGAGNNKWFTPMVSPVEFSEEQSSLPVDPYLLGYLLGNGSFVQGTPRVSVPDTETVERLQLRLPGAGLQLREVGDEGIDYSISGDRGGRGIVNPLTRELRHLGLMGCCTLEKFIPEPYLYGRSADRLALLQGLLDSDGYVGAGRNSIEYSSSSPLLAEGAMHLVRSLGGKASINERIPHYTDRSGERRAGKLNYRVQIALPSPLAPFRLQRKADAYKQRSKYQPTRAIVDIEMTRRSEAQCIVIDSDDHLYVTDDFILTHNSTMMRSLLQQAGDNERIAVVEQVPELAIGKPLVVEYLYQPTIEGFGLTEVLDFNLYNGLDRLVVGETHLEGITKMLETMILTEGSMSTYHAYSTEQAGERMKLAVQLENQNVSAQTAVSYIRQAIELVVVLQKLSNGRKVTQITEVDWRSSGGRENLGGSDIFVYERERDRFMAKTKPTLGRVEAKLEKFGVPVVDDWFIEAEDLARFRRNASRNI